MSCPQNNHLYNATPLNNQRSPNPNIVDPLIPLFDHQQFQTPLNDPVYPTFASRHQNQIYGSGGVEQWNSQLHNPVEARFDSYQNTGTLNSLQAYSATPAGIQPHLQEFGGPNYSGALIPGPPGYEFPGLQYDLANYSGLQYNSAELIGQMHQYSTLNSTGYSNQQNSSFHVPANAQNEDFNIQPPLNLPGYSLTSERYSVPQGTPLGASRLQQDQAAFNGQLLDLQAALPNSNSGYTMHQQGRTQQGQAGFNFSQFEDPINSTGYQQGAIAGDIMYHPPALQLAPGMTNQLVNYMPQNNNNNYSLLQQRQQVTNQPAFGYNFIELPVPPVLGNEKSPMFVKPEPSVPPISKPRLRWSTELHDNFMNAVKELGGLFKTTPKMIMKKMNVSGLSTDNVKSHLQKMRAKYPEKILDLDEQNANIPLLPEEEQFYEWIAPGLLNNDEAESSTHGAEVHGSTDGADQ